MACCHEYLSVVGQLISFCCMCLCAVLFMPVMRIYNNYIASLSWNNKVL